MLAACVTHAHAFESEREALEARQAELDQKCEAARGIKLAPVRSQILDECINADHGTDTEEDCRRKASTYNGNRVHGGPLYYDLPECVAAFEHRRREVKGLE
jgi:hypothetical protein